MTDEQPIDPTVPVAPAPQPAEPEEPPYDPTVPVAQTLDDRRQTSGDNQADLSSNVSRLASTKSATPTSPPPNPAAQKTQTRKPFPVWILWIVVVILLGVAGFFLFFWKGTVTVTVTPAEATVSVAGQNGQGQQTKRLSPGTYSIHAEAPGFIPFDGSVTLARSGKEQVDITLKKAAEPIQLSQQHVQFLALDQNQSSLLYLEPSTKTVYRLRFDDPVKPVIDAITPNRFDGSSDWLWSPDRGLVFLRQGGSLKLYDFNRYDLVNQTTTDWPSEVKAIDWRPDGVKVAYFFADSKTGERTLIRATKSNDEVERIYNFKDTAISNPSLTWSPDAKSIAIVEKNLFVLDVFSKTLRELKVPGPIKTIRWSPASDRLLFETEAGQLGLVGTGGEVSRLSLPGPISRAAFSSDGKNVLHASGRGSTFKLVRVNLESLDETVIPTPASKDLAADNLLLGKDDGRLFFTSGGLPYVLELSSK